MKILRFSASNFKKLVAVEIEPDGNVITITGKNGAGKSSVLDAIVTALGGKNVAPRKPIREGQEKAIIVVETDELVVTRKFTPSGSYLEVVNMDGFVAKSPQAVLDKLVGAIAFDPLAFCSKSEKEQRQILIELMGVDLATHDKKIAALAEHRKNLMAQKKTAEIDLARMPYYADAPAEEVSMTSLVAQMKQANEHNAKYRNLQQMADQDMKRLAELLEQMKRLKTEIDDVGAMAKRSQTALSQMQPIDTTQIERQAADLEELNRRVRDNASHDAASAEIGRLADQISAEFQKIKTAEADKANALAEVKLPLEGLSVDETGVLYNGIPLSQVNHARQVEISMAIQMALNPKLKVMLVNGNGLDDDTFAAITKMVQERDYQLWVEKAGDNGKVGILIEDGLVKETQ